MKKGILEQLKELIKKHIGLASVIGVCIFLLIVHTLYFLPAPNEFFVHKWEAGDFITLVGTLFLGYISIKQTKIANDMAQNANQISERLMDLESRRYKLEMRPFIMVVEWHMHSIRSVSNIFYPDKLYIQIGDFDLENQLIGLEIKFQNTSESFLSFEYITAKCENFKFGNGTINQQTRKTYLQPGESKTVVFCDTKDRFKNLNGKVIVWEFILENKFSERYKETFETVVARISDDFFCDIIVQNFSISKFIKDKKGNLNLVEETIIDGETENGNP